MVHTLQDQVDEASPKERIPVYMPPILGFVKNSHGVVNVENRHGKYDQRRDASKNLDDQDPGGKRKMKQMKRNSSSDDDSDAGNDRRRKNKSKRKRKDVKTKLQKPSGRHVE